MTAEESRADQLPLPRLGPQVAIWTGVTVLVVAHTYLVLRVRGVPMGAGNLVASALHGLSWIALTPAVAWLTLRFPLDASNRLTHFGVHLAAALVLNVAAVATIVLVALPFERAGVSFGVAFVSTLLSSFFFFLLIYAAVVAVMHAAVHARRARLRAIRTAELEAQIVRAQLDALRMQLNPHFLFNTLNSVSTLMGRDVSAARSMLADLSDLLRLALDRVNEQEIPLEEEMEFVRLYLNVEQARFRDRLVFEERLGPGTSHAYVPSLLLQPLVENAIKHGIAPHRAAGRITIEASVEDDQLVIRVSDDGRGMSGSMQSDSGLGLRNTRARLERLYGAEHSFALRDRPRGGAEAVVTVPYHTKPVESP